MKKVKIETILSDGSKITISLNGPLNRRKIENFLALINVLDSEGSIADSSSAKIVSKSIYEKVRYLAENYFNDREFTLSEFMKLYFEIFGETLKKSTLSTYLMRLVDEGILLRKGVRGRYQYRYIGSIVKLEK